MFTLWTFAPICFFILINAPIRLRMLLLTPTVTFCKKNPLVFFFIIDINTVAPSFLCSPWSSSSGPSHFHFFIWEPRTLKHHKIEDLQQLMKRYVNPRTELLCLILRHEHINLDFGFNPNPGARFLDSIDQQLKKNKSINIGVWFLNFRGNFYSLLQLPYHKVK